MSFLQISEDDSLHDRRHHLKIPSGDLGRTYQLSLISGDWSVLLSAISSREGQLRILLPLFSLVRRIHICNCKADKPKQIESIFRKSGRKIANNDHPEVSTTDMSKPMIQPHRKKRGPRQTQSIVLQWRRIPDCWASPEKIPAHRRIFHLNEMHLQRYGQRLDPPERVLKPTGHFIPWGRG
jgi:hypothetical protein